MSNELGNTIINLPVNGHDVTFTVQGEVDSDRARELIEWTTRKENNLRGETVKAADLKKAVKRIRLDPMYVPPNRVEKIKEVAVKDDAPVSYIEDVVVFATA